MNQNRLKNRLLCSGVVSIVFASLACNSPSNSTGMRSGMSADSSRALPTTGPALVSELKPDANIQTDSKKVLYYLASDELEGRGVGLHGLDLAADYIANRFQQAGLKKLPGQDSYFQPFQYPISTTLGSATALKLGDHALESRKDFTAASFSSEGSFDAPVVFVGYGISSPNEYKYDDYAGIDVKGKVVLVMRYEPRDEAGHSRFTGAAWSTAASLTSKAQTAAEKGAVAMIMVNPPNRRAGVDTSPPEGPSGHLSSNRSTTPSSQPTTRRAARTFDSLISFNMPMAGKVTIPFLHVKQTAADELLKQAGAEDLSQLQQKIDQSKSPASFALKSVTASGKVALDRKEATVKNVMAMLPGKGPHKDEYVVVGAHYDHLGRGALGGSMAFGSHEIHHGADDNGSGSTAIIETATQMAKQGPLDRSIIFMTFTAEEEGLIGSQYFVDHPPVPLDKIAFMLNMDMVGRVRNELLYVGGTGTAEDFGTLMTTGDAGSPLHLEYTGPMLDKGGMGPSDHQSFALKKIPVLFFFSGMHPQYHRPTDTADLINYEGIAESVSLAEYVVRRLAELPREQYVTKYDQSPGGMGGGGNGAALGVIPDYNAGESTGVKISGTRPNSAADKAGLKEGDVITQFNDTKVVSIYDLTSALGAAHPGDNVTIGVMRDKQKVQLHATLTGRSG